MNDNSRKSGWEWLDRDTSAFLYEYLTMGADIPEPVRKHFGFDRDYLLYEKINGMDYDEYLRQREEGRFPDVLRWTRGGPTRWKKPSRVSAAVLPTPILTG